MTRHILINPYFARKRSEIATPSKSSVRSWSLISRIEQHRRLEVGCFLEDPFLLHCWASLKTSLSSMIWSAHYTIYRTRYLGDNTRVLKITITCHEVRKYHAWQLCLRSKLSESIMYLLFALYLCNSHLRVLLCIWVWILFLFTELLKNTVLFFEVP